MTKNELKSIRATMGLSQHKLALRLGTTDSSVAHWEQGRRKISEQVENHIKLLAGTPEGNVKS